MSVRSAFTGIMLAMVVGGGPVCAPPPSHGETDHVSIAHETVFLTLVEWEKTLRSCAGWPAEEELREPLHDEVNRIRAALVDELSRCQKYGLYRVVDSLRAPTVRIELTILSPERRGDTLHLPVEARIRNTAAPWTIARSIDAFGVVDADGSSTMSDSRWLAHALADYRRRFPYRRIVAILYPSTRR
jgi:hypothetical protein